LKNAWMTAKAFLIFLRTAMVSADPTSGTELSKAHSRVYPDK
jgi:hypothetical protein